MSANGEISNDEANGGAPPHHGGGNTIHVGGTSAFAGGGMDIHIGRGHGGGHPHQGGGGGHDGNGGGGKPAPPPLDNNQRNAYQMVLGILKQYGLASLAPVVLGYVKQGYQPDAINVLIQQTPEWKQRFAGNEIRVKNGLAPYNPAEYLSMEAGYAQAIAAAGLPAGFYDGGSDFADWIGKGVSPNEVQQRADAAAQFVETTDPNARAALQDYYGIDKGHLAAFFLDQDRAMPLLQKLANAAEIGGAAQTQGLGLSRDRAEHFAQLGVTGQQAEQAYTQIGQALPGLDRLSQIYHQAYGKQDLENELLGGDANAALRRQKLQGAEESAFSGSGGAGSTLQDPGYGVAAPTAGKF